MPLSSLAIHAVQSRVAWLVAAAHGLWFLLSVANMSPPDKALGEFFDQGGWSTTALFAGRPFHFHYESAALKILILADLPGVLLMVPFHIAISPFLITLHLSHETASYFEAAYMLIGGTCQWLLLGRILEAKIKRRSPAFHRELTRMALALIVVIAMTALVLPPIIKEQRSAEGFVHPAISFR